MLCLVRVVVDIPLFFLNDVMVVLVLGNLGG